MQHERNPTRKTSSWLSQRTSSPNTFLSIPPPLLLLHHLLLHLLLRHRQHHQKRDPRVITQKKTRQTEEERKFHSRGSEQSKWSSSALLRQENQPFSTVSLNHFATLPLSKLTFDCPRTHQPKVPLSASTFCPSRCPPSVSTSLTFLAHPSTSPSKTSHSLLSLVILISFTTKKKH